MTRRTGKKFIFYAIFHLLVHVFFLQGSYIWLSSLPGANIPFLKAEESENIALSAFINFWTFVIILQVSGVSTLTITYQKCVNWQSLLTVGSDSSTAVHHCGGCQGSTNLLHGARSGSLRRVARSLH